MSVYLHLLVLEGEESLEQTRVALYDQLTCDQGNEVLQQYCEMTNVALPEHLITTKPIPPQMFIDIHRGDYDELGRHWLREDPYGDELRFVYAGELKKLNIPKDASPRSRAVAAYIAELPDDNPIVLYWC